MKQPLFPLSAYEYDKKIIEIREVLRVEKFAIIHCALMHCVMQCSAIYAKFKTS